MRRTASGQSDLCLLDFLQNVHVANPKIVAESGGMMVEGLTMSDLHRLAARLGGFNCIAKSLASPP